MAKGKLSIQEKYAIQGMLNAGNTVEQIQELLDRPKSNAVKIYVDRELEKTKSSIAKIDEEKTSKFEPEVPEEMYRIACNKLIREGMERADAEHLLNLTIKDMVTDPENENQLYVQAIQHRTALAKNFMVTKTQGQGKSGIAVMTYPGSSRGDLSGKRARRDAQSRTSRGAIWQPKQGNIRGENKDE